MSESRCIRSVMGMEIIRIATVALLNLPRRQYRCLFKNTSRRIALFVVVVIAFCGDVIVVLAVVFAMLRLDTDSLLMVMVGNKTVRKQNDVGKNEEEKCGRAF